MTWQDLTNLIAQGVEGGSDSWDRPPLPTVNPKRDTISNVARVARHSVN